MMPKDPEICQCECENLFHKNYLKFWCVTMHAVCFLQCCLLPCVCTPEMRSNTGRTKPSSTHLHDLRVTSKFPNFNSNAKSLFMRGWEWNSSERKTSKVSSAKPRTKPFVVWTTTTVDTSRSVSGEQQSQTWTNVNPWSATSTRDVWCKVVRRNKPFWLDVFFQVKHMNEFPLSPEGASCIYRSVFSTTSQPNHNPSINCHWRGLPDRQTQNLCWSETSCQSQQGSCLWAAGKEPACGCVTIVRNKATPKWVQMGVRLVDNYSDQILSQDSTHFKGKRITWKFWFLVPLSLSGCHQKLPNKKPEPFWKIVDCKTCLLTFKCPYKLIPGEFSLWTQIPFFFCTFPPMGK